MLEKKQILVGIDFIGINFPSALYSLQQWATYVSRSDYFTPIIGVSTFCERDKSLPGCPNLTAAEAVKCIKECCPRVKVVHCDTEMNDIARGVLVKNAINSQPFWSSFSYGSVVNRMLLLANEASCDYLVRIDPGTVPPRENSFDEIMQQHISWIGDSNIVVSRRYAGRLALRDIFLIEGKADKQCDLVYRMTGIDPLSQVTGGAMFTSKIPGVPAVPFDSSEAGLTLVWASDDGIYQLLEKTKGSRNIGVVTIPRFDVVGKPKSTKEYYRGVAGTVFLSSLLQGGKSRQDAALDVEEFLGNLLELLDDKKCRLIDENDNWRNEFTKDKVTPDQFLEKIFAVSYTHLTLPTICSV